MINLLKKYLGSRNERTLRRLHQQVQKINDLEPMLKKLSDVDLAGKTNEFRARLKQETLEQLLVEAFAVVREVARRTLGLRHFDVQLIGGMVLHEGNIAEMRTGEGKTLMSTLPAYLNALSGKGVHIITVNDYLAERDAEWMAPIYEFLDLTVGVNRAQMRNEEKKKAYQADITFGTNNEFGFDYLRDNMAFSLEEKTQRLLNFCIIDEVDSILIDEARTPLIISGQAEDSSERYKAIDRLVPKLIQRETEEGPGDFYLDEKSKQAYLTEAGHQKVEELLFEMGLLSEGENLYSPVNISLMHHLNAVLRAHSLFHRDVDYIISDGEVVIVDEHTGRTMPGRRWSDGLHQAVEAKEGVNIQSENQTLASITFQNYFKLYDKLSGMTGTADTEAYEFQQIYGLEVVVIPTNKSMIRRDQKDLIYLTKGEKFNAIIEDIITRCDIGQPVLVGTASIESSEYLSKRLLQQKVSHEVLNAKQHEQEAQIIAQAGRPGAVTIATNMAGRGTDIVLGGNLEVEKSQLPEEISNDKMEALEKDWQARHDKVIALGGLYIIGSERHESRRIDNQLRGRSGRQGDPGESRFYLSLEDDLMRIFAANRMSGVMERLGMGQGEALEHRWVNKIIENSQRKVEAHHFDIRKQLLEFDNVANDQRQVIYEQRSELMERDDISDFIETICSDVIEQLINQFIPPLSLSEQWDIAGLQDQIKQDFALTLPIQKWLDEDENLAEEGIRRRVLEAIIKNNDEKEKIFSDSSVMRHLEKSIMLQSLDHHWREHLSAMDHLRQGIHLRGYAQKNPKQEYKREAFLLFSELLDRLKYDTVSTLASIEIKTSDEVLEMDESRRRMVFSHLAFSHENSNEPEGETPDNAPPFRRTKEKIGRNALCHCGSKKKFKHCHGKL